MSIIIMIIMIITSIIENREKHIEHHKEDEEDIGNKEHGTQKPIFFLELLKVEFSKNRPVGGRNE